MPIIAIVNRKGGSGKSTLATHIAAYWARQGKSVMLGDIDRQQSSRTWLNLRPDSLPTILTWETDEKNTFIVPQGITHVVLDTPGGLHGFDLAKVARFASMLIIPVHNALFDLSSAAQCLAELQGLPRVVNGQCQLGAIGVRIDLDTPTGSALSTWAGARALPYLGTLRYSAQYPNASESGASIFDLSPQQVDSELREWTPILHWIEKHCTNTPASTTADNHATTPPTSITANHS